MNYSQQDALEKLRKATIDASVAQKKAQRDFEEAQIELYKWTKRHKLAIDANRKDLIPHARYEKERCKEVVSRLKNIVDGQTLQLNKMNKNYNSYKKTPSEEQTTALLREPNNNTFSDFKNIENKLLESQTNVEEVSHSHNTIDESELVNFENDESMEDELARFKGKLVNKSQYKTQDYQDLKKILNEAIEKTEETLQITVDNQKGMQKQYKQAQKEAKELHTKAQVALQNDDDNQALNVLISKTVQKKCVNVIENQLKEQQATLTLIQNNLSVLEKVKRIFESEGELVQLKAQMINKYLLEEKVDSELESLRKELDEM
jgi:phage shock protein A